MITMNHLVNDFQCFEFLTYVVSSLPSSMILNDIMIIFVLHDCGNCTFKLFLFLRLRRTLILNNVCSVAPPSYILLDNVTMIFVRHKHLSHFQCLLLNNICSLVINNYIPSNEFASFD